MPTIDRTITVPGGAEEVFAYLSDFTTTEEWDPPTQTTDLVSGDGGVGTRYRNVSKFLGRETETVYTVVTLDAPRRLELEGDASSMRLHDTITVEQKGDDVQVSYRAEFHPEGAARLATPLLPPALKALGDAAAEQMEECLRRLPGASARAS
ncbi:SRPBCC family protein [Nocardioides KLBMP 9356]|uniref:SRPBCC family protein n=1 Tax=Nocardioides potassii TaxID=2911371 RepID=A0ABS9H778_9ACTN|nr:SRPBCC family protein [Nocardioides potassii]MCF6376304.1 SRPBCC family protein [Nocardioides potassii]